MLLREGKEDIERDLGYDPLDWQECNMPTGTDQSYCRVS